MDRLEAIKQDLARGHLRANILCRVEEGQEVRKMIDASRHRNKFAPPQAFNRDWCIFRRYGAGG